VNSSLKNLKKMAQQMVVKKTFSDPCQTSVFFFNCHGTLILIFFDFSAEAAFAAATLLP
jgi:hypothetical protein